MSVQITSSGSTARTAYFNTTDSGEVDAFEVREGEAYYVECWIQAKSTNTGLGTVELVAQTNGSTVTALDSVTITSGTKGTWIQLSATYQVGSSVTSLSFGVRLAASATTSNDIFYVDDMLVRESTLVQVTNNAAVNGFSGSISTVGSSTPDDTAVVANSVKTNIQQLSTQVTALETAGTGTSNSVSPISEDFTQAADASTLGGNWSQWTTGTGTATLGITSGAALLKGSVSSYRTGFARHITASATNLHRVNLTVASFSPVPVTYASDGTYSYQAVPYIYLLGRVDSANTKYVYAKMTRLSSPRKGSTEFVIPARRFEIGYVNGGSEVPLSYVVTGNGLTPGSTYTLVCGKTSSATRTFQLLENGYVVLETTDSGSGSALSNNYTGVAMYAQNSTNAPGTVSSFSAVDLTVPTYRGSGFRRTRNSTSSKSGSSGTNVLPGSLFDTPAIITTGYTYTDSTNALVVDVDGWYVVDIGIKTGSAELMSIVLFKNDVVYSQCQVSGSGLGRNGSFIVYCAAGDKLQPGTTADTSFTIVGESTNSRTYFSVAFLNNRLPS